MDNLTKEQRKKNMRNIKSINTIPERAIMRILKQRKIYFAKHVNTLPGKPDIVFRRKGVAVFIDSDFWHGHKKRFVMPKSNRKYWRTKIERNKERDKIVNRQLKKVGWNVIRLWEYDVKRNIDKCINKILESIDRV